MKLWKTIHEYKISYDGMPGSNPFAEPTMLKRRAIITKKHIYFQYLYLNLTHGSNRKQSMQRFYKKFYNKNYLMNFKRYFTPIDCVTNINYALLCFDIRKSNKIALLNLKHEEQIVQDCARLKLGMRLKNFDDIIYFV